MVDLASIKDVIGLSEVAERFNLKERISNARLGDCPFCQAKKRFYNNSDRHYYCCGCGAKGDVFNYLVQTGAASTINEAITLLTSTFEGHSLIRDINHRVGTLNQIFDSYLAAAKANSKPVRDYYKSRGWTLRDSEVVGLCPYPGFLQEQGYSAASLTAVNLLKEGREHFNNHLIYPVYNSYGQVVHLHGRTLDSKSDLRWLSTTGPSPITNYLFNQPSLKTAKHLFITEGVSDCRSLLEIDLTAVGTFGVNAALTPFFKELEGVESIVAVYDRDKYPIGHPKQGQYKSWSNILPSLIELGIQCQKPIYTLMVPNQSGIKDLNDFLLDLAFDRAAFLDYASKAAKPIQQLAFTLYHRNLKQHPTLWRLNSAGFPLPELKDWVELNYPSWVDYLNELHKF